MMVKTGSNGNIFSYNYSQEPTRSEPISDFSGDISLHGHYAFANLFEGNKCGVHLWWNPLGDFAQRPWAKANDTASKDNLVYANEFTGDTCALHFRGLSDVTLSQNRLQNVDVPMEKDRP